MKIRTRRCDASSAGLDRRGLLRAGLGLSTVLLPRAPALGASRLAVGPLAEEPAGGRLEALPATLVLLQLSGGNDGLSTVVPLGDRDDRAYRAYRDRRDATAIAEEDALELDGGAGLHPGLERLHALYREQRLAIVQGVGYPDASRSHFESLEVWHAADLRGRAAGSGWIGRLAAELLGDDADPNRVVHMGGSAPYSLHSTRHPPACVTTPASYRWVGTEAERRACTGDAAGSGPEPHALSFLRGVQRDAERSSAAIRSAAERYRPRIEYPDTQLGAALRTAAALIQARLGARVLSVELGGFDTHNDQRARHDELMRLLDGGLGAFLDDLRGTEAESRVVVLAFSEFGRRVEENGSRGTDHGKAGPMFLAGAPVRGGLFGRAPSLEDLDEGDLRFGTDFRSVFGSVIESWHGLAHERVLGERFALLPLFAG
jgi:uncharacterized protein (DUF1501 family)